MFNGNSTVVKVWFTAVMVGGVYKYKDVPNLSNLRDEVGKKLTKMGYDLTEPEGSFEPVTEQDAEE